MPMDEIGGSPNGLQYMGSQAVGTHFCSNGHRGQAVFSPDGTMYARSSAHYGPDACQLGVHVRLYDFDRCNGLLSEKNTWQLCCGIIPTASAYASNASGVAFSSSSRFLYTNSEKFIYQIDTRNNPLTLDTVGRFNDQYDTTGFSFAAGLFNMQQLAPDGKIYITMDDGRHLHVIENPNQLGLSCNINNMGLNLGVVHAWSLPNYPHFRLGRLEGSGCDTVYSVVEDIRQGNTFKVYPNPNDQGYFIIEWTAKLEGQGNVMITDIMGRAVLEQEVSLQTGKTFVRSNHISNGVYLMKIVDTEGKELHTEKVVVIH
jgi:Secretion system C-terminal sorting domain